MPETFPDRRAPMPYVTASLHGPVAAEVEDFHYAKIDDYRAFVRAVETAVLRAALVRTNGVLSRMVYVLGIKRTTLIEKLKRFGLTEEAEALRMAKAADTG